MKYCAYCGKELPDEAVICMGCGCPTREYHRMNSENQQAQTQQQAKPVATATTNLFSILSLIFAFIQPILGIVFGKVGLNDIKKNANQKGEDLAKAGIILSIILLVLQVLAVIAVVVIFAVLIGTGDYPVDSTPSNGIAF